MLTRVVLAAAVLLFVNVSSASADPWGHVVCGQQPTAACDLGVGTAPVNGHLSTRPTDIAGTTSDAESEFASCRYRPVDRPSQAVQPEGEGTWVMVLCSPDGKDPLSHGPVWVAEGSTPPPPSPEELARAAREKLRLPSPSIAASPAGTQLVNLPTWMWLSSGWEPVSASAAVPGVSVTATASPTSVTWSMGDDSTVTCTGAGTPYNASTDPKSPSPDCGHVYRRSSASQAEQAFPVVATVHWTVAWSGAGQGGTFPDMTTTSNGSFRVAESQALNNGAS